jgi:glycosyltransferase involved in cell wall biosynthesis
LHVLVLHNRYRQAGGEDAVVRSEIELLRSRSVKVTEFSVSNDAEPGNKGGFVQLGLSAIWSRSSYRQIRQICADIRPDIAHVHNFWMKLSPAAHYACKEAGVATVQTLHNFRLFCVRADFLLDGQICQDCLGHLPWRGITRRCYRESACASAAVGGMIAAHRFLSTWRTHVDAFIALSEHSGAKFVEGGIPEQKLFVKPNFLEDAAAPLLLPSDSNVVLFVGRISEEKGLELLLDAWRDVRRKAQGTLRIVGGGSLRGQLEQQARCYGLSASEVQFTGELPYSEVMGEIGRARALVLPSLCFENCPRTLLEAFCNGRPAIVPNRGSLDELVRHEQTGLKFAAGNQHRLSDVLVRLLSSSAEVNAWGANARVEYLSRYTPTASFEKLMQIYQFALKSHCEHAHAFPPSPQLERSS